MQDVAKEIPYPVEIFNRAKYDRIFQSMGTSILNIFRASDESENKKPTPYQALKQGVPLWEKTMLTLEEAAVYSGIGVHKLREITDEKGCKFVLWNGNKRLIKRRLLDEYLAKSYSI